MAARREQVLGRAVLTVVLVLGFAASPRAGDGVLEINQACALSPDGCFIGDAGGFPVTIPAPGSYRLTGNLDVRGQAGAENVTAIEIVADNAHIDLAGFEIRGPTVCTGSSGDISCVQTGTGSGVLQPNGTSGAVVRNGAIEGMGRHGIRLWSSGRVEGILARGNGDVGIVALDGSIVAGNTVRRSGTRGIVTSGGSLVTANAVRNNPWGISMDPTDAFSHNVLSQNPVRVTVGFDAGGNVCDGATGCNDEKRVFVTNQVSMGNLTSIGGLLGGDTMCTNAANAAGLSGTYLAWISTSTESPAARFTRSTVPYVRTDGVVVANSYADLTSGCPSCLRAPINVNEFGATIGAPFGTWTGTAVSGTGSFWHCNSWQNGSGPNGQSGNANSTGVAWTAEDTPNCDQSLRVYCFEQ